jgi:hypothetical protein
VQYEHGIAAPNCDRIDEQIPRFHDGSALAL